MPLLASFFLALLCAFLAAWLLVRYERVHAFASHDHQSSGPQKFHSRPTPRIGGVPVALGLAAGMALAHAQGAVSAAFALGFALSVLPAFASGLLEDLTKKLGPDMRLWASFLSALVAVYFFDAVVSRSGIPLLDGLLTWYPLGLLLTVVAVGGVAHAVNIVDGYNGLAGMVTVLMQAALAIVAWQVGDREIVAAALCLAGGTLGFLPWNFPRGRMFAGDGGAYLWGVSTAILAVLLAHRHEEVSPWFPLAVVLYPVFETLFTVYRRRVRQATAAGLPDAKHLHQLVYRRLVRSDAAVPASLAASFQTRRNAATSPFLWALAALAILPATVFWRDTAALAALVAAFCLTYVWLYRSIVRFSVPRPLRWCGRLAGRWAGSFGLTNPAPRPGNRG